MAGAGRATPSSPGFIALYVGVATAVAALLLQAQGLVAGDGLAPRIQALPGAAQVALALLLADVVSYGLHRGAHRYAWWWRLHVVHHRATDVRWWTAYRAHPANLAIDHLVPAGVLLLVGFGPLPLAGRAIIVTVVALFAHAEAVLGQPGALVLLFAGDLVGQEVAAPQLAMGVGVPDRWLRYVVATPGYHRTHHEVDRTGANFALVLPLLDILGGTADFSRREERRFGLDGTGSAAGDPPLPTHQATSVARDRHAAQGRTHTPTQNENTLTSPASTAAEARLP